MINKQSILKLDLDQSSCYIKATALKALNFYFSIIRFISSASNILLLWLQHVCIQLLLLK